MEALDSAMGSVKRAEEICEMMKKKSSKKKSDYLHKLLENPPEELIELDCVIKSNNSRVYKGHENIIISIETPKDCSIMITDYQKEKRLTIKKITSNKCLKLTNPWSLSCGNWRIRDGNVWYKGLDVNVNIFTTNEVTWRTFKKTVKSKLGGTDLFGVDEICETNGSMNCSICVTNKKCCMIDSCRHVCLCMKCARKLFFEGNVKCPICRKEMEEKIVRVYI